MLVEADNEEEARLDIVDHIDRYADQMVQDPYVSDGVEVKWPQQKKWVAVEDILLMNSIRAVFVPLTKTHVNAS